MKVSRPFEISPPEYIEQLIANPMQYIQLRQKKGSPIFSLDEIKQQVDHFVTGANNRSSVVYLDDNFQDTYIIGDIHGDLSSLIPILQSFLNTEVDSLVFLGDYVDRGNHSLTVLILLLGMANYFPSKIVLLQGNHETLEMNKKYGFTKEIKEMYGDRTEEVTELLDLVYNHLSLAAITPQQTLCVHGGIPKSVDSIEEVAKIPLPHFKLIMEQDQELRDKLLKTLDEIKWNDPREDQEAEYEPSPRGKRSYLFNEKAISTFLSNSNCKRMARAHESHRGGFANLFDGKILHIFSSAPYFGRIDTAYIIHETADKTEILDLEFNVFKALP